jgi:hypothetical protein
LVEFDQGDDVTSPLLTRQTNKLHVELQKKYGENENNSLSNSYILLIVGTNEKLCTKEVNIDVVVEPVRASKDGLGVQ